MLDRVRVCADEPADLPVFLERLRFLKEVAPHFRYKVAINHFEFMERAPPEVRAATSRHAAPPSCAPTASCMPRWWIACPTSRWPAATPP